MALVGLMLLACGQMLGSSVGAAEARPPIRTLYEMREEGVVRQEWDLSCGAAALATLLWFQHGDPVSEREVAVGMMRRPEYLSNPALIQAREGFSLLDLKRFVDQRGYNGVGLGQMTFDDLVERAPIMVPVDLQGFNHFVVFRGALGNRVLLADPAYGNRTLRRDRFEDSWLDFPELGHVGFLVERPDGRTPPNRLAPNDRDFVALH